MSNEFYDPLVQTAGKIAEEYAISMSDVLALLLQAGRDERLVRQALDTSMNSEDARAARDSGPKLDLVQQARTLLQRAKNERD